MYIYIYIYIFRCKMSSSTCISQMKDVLVHLVEVLQDTRDPLSDRMRDEEIYERSLIEGGRGSRPRPPGCLDSGGTRGSAAVEWRRRAARAPAAPSMPASRVGACNCATSSTWPHWRRHSGRASTNGTAPRASRAEQFCVRIHGRLRERLCPRQSMSAHLRPRSASGARPTSADKALHPECVHQVYVIPCSQRHAICLVSHRNRHVLPGMTNLAALHEKPHAGHVSFQHQKNTAQQFHVHARVSVWQLQSRTRLHSAARGGGSAADDVSPCR